MPHQGFVAAFVSGLSLLITLGLITYIFGFGREKKNLAANSEDSDAH